MSEYKNLKIGKLILKGEKPKKNKKHKRNRDDKSKAKCRLNLIDEDQTRHCSWWIAKTTSDVMGSIAIEFGENCYLKALDNGLFTLGKPHNQHEAPDPEEIFTAFPIDERKVSFKSGYGKYLKSDINGIVTGRSEAVGSLEQWEPIFENRNMVLRGENGCFMSIDEDENCCVALRKKVGEREICQIRCNASRDKVIDETPTEEKGDLAEVEKNYVKKFQKFQDKRLRISKCNIKELEEAKSKGNLHEALLDRRSKIKADRYCK